MIKSMKVQLKPNNKQLTKLFQYAGTARFAYNWALAREKENYEQGNKFLSDGELRREFTQFKKRPENGWLNQISNNVTKQAIKDACIAYKNFFKGQSEFPKFKSRKRSKPGFYQDCVKIKFTETHVVVEGFANSRKRNKQKLNQIRLCEKGRIPTEGRYLNPRFSFDGLHWWVSVGIEYEDSTEIRTGEGVGIDIGVKELAVCSDGITYKNINKTKQIKKEEKKKRRLQRCVSRKYEKNKKGGSYQKTCNIIKSERKLLKTNRRLTNIRHNYTHQIASAIIKRKPSFVCIEDLNVSGMMKNRHLSKAIQQQNLRELRRQLEYKAEWNRVSVVVADRWYPSSKLCCCCGEIKKNLKLSERMFRCECGNVIDRDFQASLNLKAYGERKIKFAV